MTKYNNPSFDRHIHCRIGRKYINDEHVPMNTSLNYPKGTEAKHCEQNKKETSRMGRTLVARKPKRPLRRQNVKTSLKRLC